jgi:hypothetical protein
MLREWKEAKEKCDNCDPRGHFAEKAILILLCKQMVA